MTDPEAFVRANTVLSHGALVPEIRLMWLGSENVKIRDTIRSISGLWC